MEDKHYAELAKIRFQRAKELVWEAEVLLEKGMIQVQNAKNLVEKVESYEGKNG